MNLNKEMKLIISLFFVLKKYEAENLTYYTSKMALNYFGKFKTII